VRRLREHLAKSAFDLRTLPGDAMLAWRNEGWSGVWDQIRIRSVRRVFRRIRLYVIEQALDSFREVDEPAGITISRFDGPDWSRLDSILGRRRLRRCQTLAARGRICLVAWRGDRPVGYTWISEQVEPDLEAFPIPLPHDAAYLWDLYVLPYERGHHIGSALTSARLAHVRRLGYRFGWRMVEITNRASLRTVARTVGPGSHVAGQLTWIKFGPWTRTIFRPCSEEESRDTMRGF